MVGVVTRQPKVSIVMPARDAAHTIATCMDSIFHQSLQDFEIVVVDDGSTDGTGTIVQRLAQQDERIRYTYLARRGIVTALNTGLRLARSEYVARMDADDIMHPERLAMQFHYLRDHPGTSLVASQARLFSNNEIKAGYREYMRWQNTCLSHDDICNDIYLESPFAHPSVMFRKSIVQALGSYRDGPFPEDYDLWLRMFQHGCRFHKLARIHLEWRESTGRASRIDPRYARKAFDRLRSEYLINDNRVHSERPIAVWGAGRRTRQRVANVVDRGLQVDCWIDIDPRKIGNKINNRWVCAPQVLQAQSGVDKLFVLCYVSNHGARERIAGQLNAFGYKRGGDYLMVG